MLHNPSTVLPLSCTAPPFSPHQLTRLSPLPVFLSRVSVGVLSRLSAPPPPGRPSSASPGCHPPWVQGAGVGAHPLRSPPTACLLQPGGTAHWSSRSRASGTRCTSGRRPSSTRYTMWPSHRLTGGRGEGIGRGRGGCEGESWCPPSIFPAYWYISELCVRGEISLDLFLRRCKFPTISCRASLPIPQVLSAFPWHGLFIACNHLPEFSRTLPSGQVLLRQRHGLRVCVWQMGHQRYRPGRRFIPGSGECQQPHGGGPWSCRWA